MLVASRWIHFASMSAVFGGSLFWFYIGPRPVTACLQGLPVTAAWTLLLLRAVALLAAVSGLGWLAATIASVTGGAAGVVDAGMLRVFFFETPFGGPSLARLVLLVMLALAAILPLTPVCLISSCALLAIGLLASQAWFGHAAQGGISPYGMAMILSYVIHVIGAAAWVGGLLPLSFAVGERRRSGDNGYELLARYSAMATGAVFLIVVSGIANTLFRTSGELDRLPSTAYGAVLGTKLTLVAAMLALATFNRFVAMPRLRATRAQDRNLVMSIAAETLLAMLVFGAAALLGITPPPH